MTGKDLLYRILGDASQGISEFEKFAKKAQDLTHVGRAGMIMGGLIAAGVGLAVAKYAEFDAAMSNVISTGEDAARNQDALREAAMQAGASTVFSATESANAIEELAKAGVSAEDTLAGGLAGALDLAAAGGLGVADAATIMATSMNQFAVDGRNATHVADLLAAGAGKAQGDVSDMSAALAQAGLVANSTGLSIEETTGGLAAFASAGLLGSDAGTSFKSMLQRLTPQSAAAQSEMDRLGISAYDASGNFIGLADFAGNLKDSLRALTPEQRQSAMATIFGSDAVRAATILYDKGAEGIQEWTDAVNDQGYAAQVARTRLDNLQGDVEALGGAFDSALIAAGSGANDGLRALTQTATGAVGAFAELPAPVQEAGTYLAVAAAAVALLGGAAIVAVPKISALQKVVSQSGGSFQRMGLAAGAATVGLAAVIAIVSAVASAQAEAEARAESYADAIADGADRSSAAFARLADEGLEANSKLLGLFDLGGDSAYENAKQLGLSLGLVRDAALGNADALRELQQVQNEIANSSTTELMEKNGWDQPTALLAKANIDSVVNAVKGENATIEEAIKLAGLKAEAERESTVETKSSAAAYLESSEAVEGLTDELDQLIESISSLNGTGQDAVTTNARYRESLAGIAAEVQSQKDAYEKANGSLDGFTLSLDESTVSGSAAAAMLAAVAGDAQKAAEAQYELDKTTVGADAATANMMGTLAVQRQAFIDSATQAGYNADEVQRLADKVFALPPEKTISILTDTAAASTELANFVADAERRIIRLGVTTYAKDGPAGQLRISTPGTPDRYAGGGTVRGPGTGTSDSILALLSNGEFVVREEVARDNLSALEHLNDYGSLPAYAGGGTVSLVNSGGSRVQTLALAGRGSETRGDREVVEPLDSYQSHARELALAAAAQANVGGDRPIYADGIGLIGWVRDIAGQEAELVWNTGEAQRTQMARMGRQRSR